MCLLYSMKLWFCSVSLIVFLLVRNTYCLLPTSLTPYTTNTVHPYFSRAPPSLSAQNIFGYPNIYPGKLPTLPPPPPPPPNFCLINLIQSFINYVSSPWANQNNVQYQSSSNSDYYQYQSSSSSNYNSNYNTQSSSDSVDYSFLEEDSDSSANYAEPVLVTQEEDSNNYSEPELISIDERNRISQNLVRRKRETRTEDGSNVKYGLIAASLLVFQAGSLAAFGQPFISKSGVVKLWDGDIYGSENSQQIMDWYTFSHGVHGLILYELLDAIDPTMPVGLRLVVSMSIEVIWEVLENTPFLIERYRQTAISQGYVGDSIINSISDTLAMALGFLIAEKLHWTAVLALIFAEELFVGYAIRDNLALNIINFVHPFERITEWQAQGRPKRSKLK